MKCEEKQKNMTYIKEKNYSIPTDPELTKMIDRTLQQLL